MRGPPNRGHLKKSLRYVSRYCSEAATSWTIFSYSLMSIASYSLRGRSTNLCLCGSYVCVYVCVCIYIYIYTHIHTYIHTCIHTYMHTYMHTNKKDIKGKRACKDDCGFVFQPLNYTIRTMKDKRAYKYDRSCGLFADWL